MIQNLKDNAALALLGLLALALVSVGGLYLWQRADLAKLEAQAPILEQQRDQAATALADFKAELQKVNTVLADLDRTNNASQARQRSELAHLIKGMSNDPKLQACADLRVYLGPGRLSAAPGDGQGLSQHSEQPAGGL